MSQKVVKIDPHVAGKDFKELIQILKQHPSIARTNTDFCNFCWQRRSETSQMHFIYDLLFCNSCGLRMNRKTNSEFAEVCVFDSNLLYQFELGGNVYEMHNNQISCPALTIQWPISFNEPEAITVKDGNSTKRIVFDRDTNTLTVFDKPVTCFNLDANRIQQYYISYRGVLVSPSDLFSLRLIRKDIVPTKENRKPILDFLQVKLKNFSQNKEYMLSKFTTWLVNLPICKSDKIDLFCKCAVVFIVVNDSIAIRSLSIRKVISPEFISKYNHESARIELLEDSSDEEEQETAALTQEELSILLKKFVIGCIAK